MPQVDVILIEVPDEIGGYAQRAGRDRIVSRGGGGSERVYSHDRIRL